MDESTAKKLNEYLKEYYDDCYAAFIVNFDEIVIIQIIKYIVTIEMHIAYDGYTNKFILKQINTSDKGASFDFIEDIINYLRKVTGNERKSENIKTA